MKKFTVLSTPKTWMKEWFSDGTWSWDTMTSVIVEKDNGKLIQIFGSAGTYGEIGECVALYSDKTCRQFGHGTIVGYSKEFVKGISTSYVFK